MDIDEHLDDAPSHYDKLDDGIHLLNLRDGRYKFWCRCLYVIIIIF